MTRHTIANVRRRYTTPASAEQREVILALGGRPPEYLTPGQANKAINALRWRQRQRARVAAQVAALAR